MTAVGARTDSALQTDTPFIERLVHRWSNHFAVLVDKLRVVGLAGGFGRTVAANGTGDTDHGTGAEGFALDPERPSSVLFPQGGKRPVVPRLLRS